MYFLPAVFRAFWVFYFLGNFGFFGGFWGGFEDSILDFLLFGNFILFLWF